VRDVEAAPSGAVPVPDTFHAWAATADAIRATSKRLEKSALLEAYLPTLDEGALAIAARFLSGFVFPRHDMRTTQVGGSIVHGALAAVSGVDPEELHERYVAIGDSGDLAGELFADRPPSGVTLGEVERWFASLALAGGTNARRAAVREMIAGLGGLEARYLVKLLGGELRIGLKEAQVEEALARAFGRPLTSVRRANLLRGDVGEVARYARTGSLDSATLALFHPLGFMLAQPLPTAEEIVANLPAPFAVEDKYDGIRAQAHVTADRVALYSRTLDEITWGYPDVVATLEGIVGNGAAVARPRSANADGVDPVRSDESGGPMMRSGGDPGASGSTGPSSFPSSFPSSLILDGELIAIDPADPRRALPFKALQRRLGRKAPTDAVLAEVPVAFVVYDVLAADSALVIDEPYAARRARLERLAWPERGASLAPVRLASSPDDVERAFASARAAGNEGIIAKDPASPYTPGRRGKSWIKLKRAMATLDVVVTGVERGHGRRRGVLSDYTFAVRASESDPTLLNVGKAYNGLTDAEIVELTRRFEALTLQRFGRYHQVRPEIVLEVTFDVVQPSARHKAGYALRFPRIVRVRDDKPVSEIDTLARVRELAGDDTAAEHAAAGEAVAE
jgi:DNA ligase-1